MLFSTPSFAKLVRKHVVENPTADLMTYQQLMQLTPAQRVAYIKDVREVLVLLEKMEIKARQLSYQSAEASILREKISAIASLLAAVPEALAEQDDFIPPEKTYVFPVLKGDEGWSCAVPTTDRYQPNTYTFNQKVGTCVREGSLKNSLNIVKTDYGPFATATPRTCDAHETAVYVAGDNTDGASQVSSYCVPNTSLNQMKHARAMALQDPNAPAPSTSLIYQNDGLSFKKSTTDITLGGAELQVRHGLENGDTAIAVARVDRFQEMEHRTPQAPAPAAPPPAAQPAQDTPVAQQPPQQNGPKVVKTEKIPGGPQEVALKEDAQKFKQDAGPAVVEKPAAPPIVAKNECKPLQANEMNGARGQWAKLKDKTVCINAGNFLNYSEVAEGKCDPVHKAQNYPDNLLYVTLQGSPMKNQARGCGPYEMCAPEVFCDSSANEKDPNAKITVFCVPLSGKDDDYKNKAFTQICSKATNQKKCDPMSIKGPTQEAWKQLASDYKKNHDVFCAGTSDDNKNFRNFFCSECKAVADRLAKWTSVTASLAPAAPAAPAPAAPATTKFNNYNMPGGGFDSLKQPGTSQ